MQQDQVTQDKQEAQKKPTDDKACSQEQKQFRQRQNQKTIDIENQMSKECHQLEQKTQDNSRSNSKKQDKQNLTVLAKIQQTAQKQEKPGKTSVQANQNKNEQNQETNKQEQEEDNKELNTNQNKPITSNQSPLPNQAKLKKSSKQQIQSLQFHEQRHKQIQRKKLIMDILTMQNDFQALQERSEQLKNENQYFARHIDQFKIIIQTKGKNQRFN